MTPTDTLILEMTDSTKAVPMSLSLSLSHVYIYIYTDDFSVSTPHTTLSESVDRIQGLKYEGLPISSP